MASSSIKNEEATPKSRIGGLVVTLVFHAGLLLLFIFVFSFKPPVPPPPDLDVSGMEVRMGDINAGGPNTDPLPDASSVPAASTGAEELLTDEQGEPLETPVSTSTDNNVQAPQQQVDPNALLRPGVNSNAGSGDGQLPGLQGGRGDGNSTRGSGTGTSGNGWGSKMGGRKVVHAPEIKNPTNEEGTVVVRIKVDRTGKILSAVALLEGTTNTDPKLIGIAQRAALEFKYAPLPDGPEIQVGTMEFNYKQQ